MEQKKLTKKQRENIVAKFRPIKAKRYIVTEPVLLGAEPAEGL